MLADFVFDREGWGESQRAVQLHIHLRLCLLRRTPTEPAGRFAVSGKHSRADDSRILAQFAGHDAASVKGGGNSPVAGLLSDRFDQDFAGSHYPSAHDYHLYVEQI